MNKNNNIDFSHTKQARAKKTLDDILEAAYLIVEEGKPEAFTIRTLSNKSGYALGTLIKRLNSIDNVFLWAIKKGQARHFESLAKTIEDFDENLPLNILIDNVIDLSFAAIQRVNPKVIQYFEKCLAEKGLISSDFFNYVDVLIKPYLEAASNNKTGTFRIFSEDEARLIFRAILVFAERPFVEVNPIAGTQEHREIVKENLTRLLGQLEPLSV